MATDAPPDSLAGVPYYLLNFERALAWLAQRYDDLLDACVDAITIATEAEEPTPPCGICRQVLEEFSPQLLVVSVTAGGREARWSLEELLPRAFTPKSLDRR